MPSRKNAAETRASSAIACDLDAAHLRHTHCARDGALRADRCKRARLGLPCVGNDVHALGHGPLRQDQSADWGLFAGAGARRSSLTVGVGVAGCDCGPPERGRGGRAYPG